MGSSWYPGYTIANSEYIVKKIVKNR